MLTFCQENLVLQSSKNISLSIRNVLGKICLELKFALLMADDNLNKLKRVQLNLDKEIARYSNEKESIESKIDSLENDKRKLLREVIFNF